MLPADADPSYSPAPLYNPTALSMHGAGLAIIEAAAREACFDYAERCLFSWCESTPRPCSIAARLTYDPPDDERFAGVHGGSDSWTIVLDRSVIFMPGAGAAARPPPGLGRITAIQGGGW